MSHNGQNGGSGSILSPQLGPLPRVVVLEGFLWHDPGRDQGRKVTHCWWLEEELGLD